MHRSLRRSSMAVFGVTVAASLLLVIPTTAARASDAGASPAPTASPEPTVSPDPSPEPTPGPTASAEPTPAPTPAPTPLPTSPTSLNHFRLAGFRYQDPNYVACTATAVQDILNFVALSGHGGSAFLWHASVAGSTRDAVLRWEQGHDTIVPTARGTDPHGMRNALNHFGWGDSTLRDRRVYEDMSFDNFNAAVRTAVRQMILTNRPIAVIGWAGRHAQMWTGYYGLRGDPFARDAEGHYRNEFTVAGVYFSDPLRADGLRNARISLINLRGGSTSLRFRRYTETDSPYDDPYTTGSQSSLQEWYGHYVLIVPVR